jgi:hypothetical protein
MPITREDVERLVTAHEKVHRALSKSEPRMAAQILCGEFRNLLAMQSFWQGVDSAPALFNPKDKEQAAMLVRNIPALLDDEAKAFAARGIEDNRANEVLLPVYAAFRLVSAHLDDARTVDALGGLRAQLERATALVCQASQGPIRSALHRLVSWKGARVLAGAAVVAVNVVIAPNAAALSWTSVSFGITTMTGDLEDIIKALGDVFKS